MFAKLISSNIKGNKGLYETIWPSMQRTSKMKVKEYVQQNNLKIGQLDELLDWCIKQKEIKQKDYKIRLFHNNWSLANEAIDPTKADTEAIYQLEQELPLIEWIRNQIKNISKVDLPKNLRELNQYFGSWNINLIQNIDMPTLGRFWSKQAHQKKTGVDIDLPISFKVFEITDTFSNHKVYLMLFRCAFLSSSYYPLCFVNRDDWKKCLLYFRPLIKFDVHSADLSFRKAFNDSSLVSGILGYNFFFNNYIAAFFDTAHPSKTLMTFPISYIDNITDRSMLRTGLQAATENTLGVVRYNHFQMIFTDNTELDAGNYWYTLTEKNQVSQIPCSIQEISKQLAEKPQEYIPNGGVDEILEYSKPLIEKQIQEFPKSVQNAHLDFENIDNVTGHCGIYLLIGHDKLDGSFVVKVGRTKDFKQRALLYTHTVDTSNNYFARNTNVLMIDFLSLDNINAINHYFKNNEIDSETYTGAEALFRNYFLYLQKAKYGNEWFSGKNEEQLQILIQAFQTLKKYILDNPNVFYDFLHQSLKKMRIVSYIKFLREKEGLTPQEMMDTFKRE